MDSRENKVIYQVYPKSFYDSNGDGIGDINGILAKLDYLKNLGIDFLWLSPINKSPQKDNGYDISDYYAIDPCFGSIEDFQNLISEAAKCNIGIIMDLVLNHTSTEHPWFQKALNGDAVYQDYYFFRDQPTDMQSIFGGSAWNYAPERNQYYFCFFDKTQADLNWENPQVRQDLYAMINYWIDFGVKGFRLDVIDHISKDLDAGINSNGPRFLEFLKELNQATFTDKLLTVGECWFASVDAMNKICHNDGLFQAFHFEDIVHTNGNSKWDQSPFNLEKLSAILDKWQNHYDGCNAFVMNNHDLPRLISLWLNDKEYRYEAATLLITIYSFLKGNLYLYQGEEIGMTNANFQDIALYDDVESLNAYSEMLKSGISASAALQKIMPVSRDNARTPMQWNASPHAGFTSTEPWLKANSNYTSVNAENDLLSEKSVYRYYQRILALRKQLYAELKNHAAFKVEGSCLIIQRDRFSITANFQTENIPLKLEGECLISNYSKTMDTVLQGYECRVLQHT